MNILSHIIYTPLKLNDMELLFDVTGEEIKVYVVLEDGSLKDVTSWFT